MDLGLPDIDGLEVIRRLRDWAAVPIIVLLARGQERDKITGLKRRCRRLRQHALRAASSWRVSTSPCASPPLT
jgi:CheY-like chemotaxis protein